MWRCLCSWLPPAVLSQPWCCLLGLLLSFPSTFSSVYGLRKPRAAEDYSVSVRQGVVRLVTAAFVCVSFCKVKWVNLQTQGKCILSTQNTRGNCFWGQHVKTILSEFSNKSLVKHQRNKWQGNRIAVILWNVLRTQKLVVRCVISAFPLSPWSHQDLNAFRWPAVIQV